ncbi:MAG: MATE family efflux transporter [Puniceicoccales bacterium]|jgi:MATE family multidrug resistance protein|nr:MATE family efflux transporter [Puniceicoccales bacterium]
MGSTVNNRQISSSTSGILKIIVPLILSALSSNLLCLIDRAILMHYSIDSMNAAMLGGNLAGFYTYVLISIAGTTEIFVGQYNGAMKHDKIAAPIWQMIYFVGASLFFVIPMAWFSKYLNLIPKHYAEDGIAFQKILIYFCWLPALTAVFTGFFVGRGRTKIITLIVVVGSIVNVILDCMLIFGCGDIIPSMGCRGAAWATIIAEAVQVLILAASFWSRSNRRIYNTAGNSKFDKKLFMECLRVGCPMSLGRAAEILAWYLVYVALSHVSKELGTVHGIASTIYIFFAFVCEGLSKGTAAITSNFIGRQDLASIQKVFKRLISITLVLCFAVMSPLLIIPELVFEGLSAVNSDIAVFYPMMAAIFRILFVAITLEALTSTCWGTLLAGGDTKYPIIVNLLCLGGFVVLPVGILFATGKLNSAVLVQFLSMCWNAVCLILLYRRYKGLKWYRSFAF